MKFTIQISCAYSTTGCMGSKCGYAENKLVPCSGKKSFYEFLFNKSKQEKKTRKNNNSETSIFCRFAGLKIIAKQSCENYIKAIICEDETQKIDCDSKQKRIFIVEGFYGWKSP